MIYKIFKNNVLIISILALIIFQSCKPEEELTLQVPLLQTKKVSNITDSSAVSGGVISLSGASLVSERGVCWATYPQPSINDNKTTDGEGTGEFTSYVKGLNAETYYYLRAYAVNKAGVGYGNDIKFFATSTPVVVTKDFTELTSYSVTCGGSIVSDGGSKIKRKGVCWGTKPNPDIHGFNTYNGQDTNSFISTVLGLKEDTTYYIRAYATNENELTGYGEEFSIIPKFYCGDKFRDNRDGQIYASVLIGNQCWMQQNLNYGDFITDDISQSIDGYQKYCCSNDVSNCDKYGGMYSWYELMNGEDACNGTGEAQPHCDTLKQGICPYGWHVPSHYEWTYIEKLAGSSPEQFPYDASTTGPLGTDEGNAFKKVGSAWGHGQGSAEFGFNALPGGFYSGQFRHLGDRILFWTCTENSSGTAWYRSIGGLNGQITRVPQSKSWVLYLRCVKN